MANPDDIEERRPADDVGPETVSVAAKPQGGIARTLADPKTRMVITIFIVVVLAGYVMTQLFSSPPKQQGVAPTRISDVPSGRPDERIVTVPPSDDARVLLEAENDARVKAAKDGGDSSVAPILPTPDTDDLDATKVETTCGPEVLNFGTACSGNAPKVPLKERTIVPNVVAGYQGSLTAVCGADGKYTLASSSCSAIPTPPQQREDRGAGRGSSASSQEDPLVQKTFAAIQAVQANVRNYKGATVTAEVANPDALAAAAAEAAPPAPAQVPQQPARKLASATEIFYAILDNEADSDQPGPILATVVGQKFSGAKLLGRFQLQKETMTLVFNQMVWRNRSYPINTIAINPDTQNKTGFATDVDHHYVTRIGGLFLGTFVAVGANAYAQALENQNQTIVFDQNGRPVASQNNIQDPVRIGVTRGAAATAGSVAGEIVKQTSVPITVRVAAGTEMGILVLNDIIEQPNQSAPVYVDSASVNSPAQAPQPPAPAPIQPNTTPGVYTSTPQPRPLYLPTPVVGSSGLSPVAPFNPAPAQPQDGYNGGAP